MHTRTQALRLFLPALAVLATGFAMLAFSAVSNAGASTNAGASSSDDRIENSDVAIDFRNDTRKLWEDHVTWTRLAIISLADGLPDQDASVGRLLQNQIDIGDSIEPYYGEAAGDQLTALLQDHIVIAAGIIGAAKAGDTAAVDDATAAWYANADEIAAFLSAANPDAWPLAHMQQMMRDHLDLTFDEAVARLSADYPTDVAAYDAIHGQILEMADMISLGIIHQFPKRFK